MIQQSLPDIGAQGDLLIQAGRPPLQRALLPQVTSEGGWGTSPPFVTLVSIQSQIMRRLSLMLQAVRWSPAGLTEEFSHTVIHEQCWWTVWALRSACSRFQMLNGSPCQGLLCKLEGSPVPSIVATEDLQWLHRTLQSGITAAVSYS